MPIFHWIKKLIIPMHNHAQPNTTSQLSVSREEDFLFKHKSKCILLHNRMFSRSPSELVKMNLRIWSSNYFQNLRETLSRVKSFCVIFYNLQLRKYLKYWAKFEFIWKNKKQQAWQIYPRYENKRLFWHSYLQTNG